MLIQHDITQQDYCKKTFKLQLIYLKKLVVARICGKKNQLLPESVKTKPAAARIANKNLSQI